MLLRCIYNLGDKGQFLPRLKSLHLAISLLCLLQTDLFLKGSLFICNLFYFQTIKIKMYFQGKHTTYQSNQDDQKIEDFSYICCEKLKTDIQSKCFPQLRSEAPLSNPAIIQTSRRFSQSHSESSCCWWETCRRGCK